MTWNELLTKSNGLVDIIDSDLFDIAHGLDVAFNEKYEEETFIRDLLERVREDYFTANGIWKDLPIWLSSFKENDRRFSFIIRDKLTRYMTFLTKMVIDEGLQRKLSIDKGFNNSASSGSRDKGYFSETPQMELDNFEEGIAYASNLSKNESTANSSQNGTSYTRESEATWKEQMENLRFAFYNELAEYIANIPNMAYSYFCLDGRPAGDIQIEYRKYLKDVVDNL